MLQLHIANTFFENELASKNPLGLKAGFHSHPLFLQLQFLPFLYGHPDDCVLVTHPPSPEFIDHLESQGIQGPKRWYTFSAKIPPAEIICWGLSRGIAEWAKQKHLTFSTPSLEVVEEVNSKAFSFSCSKPLDDARLLYHAHDLDCWAASFRGPKVLKSCFGLSGRGHFHLTEDNISRAHAFAKPEWDHGRAILAEPWVHRLFDFSTQWHVASGKIDYLGATICENDAFGRYRATHVGDERQLFGSYFPFLEEHKEIARSVLTNVAVKGFFGNIGFDAMIYENKEKLHLHPIVEINARKTMGWVALEIARRHFPGRSLRISLMSGENATHSLLPHSVDHHKFSKQLNLVLMEKSLSR